TVLALLNDIRNATTATGSVTELADPSIQRFSFQNFGKALRRYPTGRLDLNLTNKHRLSGSYTVHTYDTSPDILNSDDPLFPGFPASGSQTSTRQMFNTSLRSTLSGTMVNELRGGFTYGFTKFRPEITPETFSNQAGFGLGISGFNGINLAYNSRNPSTRGAPTYFVEETLSWLKGRHSVQMGGAFTQNNLDLQSGNRVPSVTFGIDSNDPAYGLFTTANFPGASSTALTNARNLYAVLTGSVTAITGAAVLDGGSGNYVYMGRAKQLARQRTVGLFASDQWKVRSDLTLNFGVRYELQLPFTPLNNYYSKVASPDMLYGISGQGNLFKPGVLSGQPTQFVQFPAGEAAYATDYNNFAPSVGLAWRVNPKTPWLQKLLSNDAVVRAGYSLSYVREGMNAVDSLFNANPGGTIAATRSMALGTLVNSYSQLPVLLRQGERLGAPAFPEKPNYPLTPGNGYGYSDSVNLFDPDLKVPYVHSFSLGFQRSVTRNTAVELRYTGNRNRGGFVIGGRNYNEVNIRENGFLDEFKVAQANLQANIAANRGNTFRYFGEGTGTSPLPIMLGYFSGSNAATDPGQYTSTLFSNSTYLNYLAQYNPNPRSLASSLYGDATRRGNALNANLPANLFLVNPDVGGGGTWMTTNERWTNYDALQIEVRRRLSAGLQVLGGYTYARGEWGEFYTLRNGAEAIPRANTPRHAYKASWVFELPFGHGRKFGSGVGKGLDRLIGGWEFDGAGRVLSGQFMDFGNVRLVNMTADDLQDMYKFRIDPATRRVTMLPADVLENTIKAWNVSATSPTGYSTLGAPDPNGRYIAPPSGPGCVQDLAGDCAPRHTFVRAPYFVRFDMSLVKRLPIAGRITGELRAEVLNVFDNINFTPVAPATTAVPFSSANYGEVTAAYRDSSNTQDPGGRIMQLSWRVSW
ncbi:MAG TPA: TonB-dependent receptor, partial [Vicinamibacterales bacterium]|nr:TonB-dependent receptor [Vicinamibacterales bacterium]